MSGSSNRYDGSADTSGAPTHADRADLWEAGADERERLADERERVADEREALAEEREQLADRHERAADRRVAARREAALASGDLDEDLERAETLAAMQRAEAAVHRAEAELLRVRQAADRLLSRSDLRAAAAARAAAAGLATETVDDGETTWLAERRDFVAAERERLANERDSWADERDEVAAQRERLADERDHGARERERELDRAGGAVRSGRGAHVPTDDPSRDQMDLRARAEAKRATAAARRRASARERARAAGAWGPVAYGPRLVASFAELAQQLFVTDELTEVIPRRLKFSVGAVAGCDWASATLWRQGRTLGTFGSAAVAAELDELQFGTEIGPALDALNEQSAIYVGRLAESTRWPVLAETAAQLGVASVLCHGLFVHRFEQWSALGTFSLYSATPDAFSEEDQDFGSILAAYLSVAMAMAQRREDVDRREAALHRGLGTRDVIGQAKGILMQRQGLTAGEAFDVLRRASQRLNRKIADVAVHLAETGELL
jgi:ANTAR domain